MNRNFDDWRSDRFTGVNDNLDADTYVNETNIKEYIQDNPGSIANIHFARQYVAQIREMGYEIDDEGRLSADSLEKVIKAKPDLIIFEEFIKTYSKELKQLGFLDPSHNGELHMSRKELAEYLKKFPQIKNNEYFGSSYGEGALAVRELRKEIEENVN